LRPNREREREREREEREREREREREITNSMISYIFRKICLEYITSKNIKIYNSRS